MSLLDLLLASVPNLAKPPTRTDTERNVLRIPVATPAVRHGTLTHDTAGAVTDTAAPERVSVYLGPGATFEGLADTLMPLFDAAKAGGGPNPPSIGDLARALVVYNKDRLPTGDWRHHQVGLRLTLPVEVAANGDWIVDATKIGRLAAGFDGTRWRTRLTAPPTPLPVPDPFVLESEASSLIAATPALDGLAAELWTRTLRNPFEAVLLLFAVLRELDRPPPSRSATVALTMLKGATAGQADLLAATSAGNAILRRLAELLKAVPAGAAGLADAKKLLDDALFDVSQVGLVVVRHYELPQTPGQMVRFGIANPTPGAADDPFGGVHRLVLGRDLAVGQIDSRQAAGVTYRGPEFPGRVATEPYLAAEADALNPGDVPRTAALLALLANAPGAALDAVSARGPGLLSVGLDRWSATAVDGLPALLLAFKRARPDEFDLYFALHGLDVDAPDPARPLQGRLLKLGTDGTPAPMDAATLRDFLGGEVALDGTVAFSPEWAARVRLPALVSKSYRRLQVAQALVRLGRVTPTPKVDSIRPALDVPLTIEELTAVGAGRTFRVATTSRSLVDINGYERFNPDTTYWEQAGKALVTHGKIVPDPAVPTKFLVPTPMRICFPEDPARPGVVAGAGPLPVVLIVHGNHAAFEPIFAPPTKTVTKLDSTGAPVVLDLGEIATSVTEVPNHEGYGRLQDLLATVGIVSVSVSTNAANFFGSLIEMRTRTAIAALEHLETLNADPASRYRGRLDLRKIGVMGHSRGGDVAVAVAKQLQGHARFTVRTVCSLAPTDFTGTATDATQLRMTPADAAFYLVVYGTHDGDVSGFGGADGFVGTGFRHYDRATCPKAMVQLARCCHNRFNSVWSDGNPAVPGDPLKKFQGDDDDIIPADLLLLRSFKEHQRLEVEYIGGLFRWQLLGHTGVRDLLDGTRPNRVGAPASLQWSFGTNVLSLDDLEDAAAPSVPGATRTFTAGGRAAFPDITVPESTIEAGGGAGPVAIGTHTTHRSQVLRVDATATTTSAVAMTLRFPPPVPAGAGPGNWSGFGVLTFRLSYTLDISAVGRFLAAPRPKTALKLTDHGGRSRRLPNATAFTAAVPSLPEYHQVITGKDPITHAPIISNATLFRFETVRVPLEQFSYRGGVDLAKVKELVVEFDRSVKTRVLFDSFQLVKR